MSSAPGPQQAPRALGPHPVYILPGQAPLREIKHPALPWDPATLSCFFPRQSSGRPGLCQVRAGQALRLKRHIHGTAGSPGGLDPEWAGLSAQAGKTHGGEPPGAGDGAWPQVTRGRRVGTGNGGAPPEPLRDLAARSVPPLYPPTLWDAGLSLSAGPPAPGPREFCVVALCQGSSHAWPVLWGRALTLPRVRWSHLASSCLRPGLSTLGTLTPGAPKGQRQAVLSAQGRDHPTHPHGC